MSTSMKPIKLTMIALAILLSSTVNAQIHFGINSGSTSWIGAEIGYSINENLHFGVKLHPSFDVANVAGFYGGYFRKTFEEREIFNFGYSQWSLRPLVFGTLGYIPSITSSSIDWMTGNTTSTSTKSQIGGCVGGGVEFLWGKSARIASPLEIGVGKMPSIFSSINSIASETNKTTSAFYFNAGLRIYIGPRD